MANERLILLKSFYVVYIGRGEGFPVHYSITALPDNILNDAMETYPEGVALVECIGDFPNRNVAAKAFTTLLLEQYRL